MTEMSGEYIRKATAIKYFVKDYWIVNCYGPSVQEITNFLGLASTNTAQYWLTKMAARGDILISTSPNDNPRSNRQRTIRLPDMQIIFLSDFADSYEDLQPDSESIAV